MKEQQDGSLARIQRYQPASLVEHPESQKPGIESLRSLQVIRIERGLQHTSESGGHRPLGSVGILTKLDHGTLQVLARLHLVFPAERAGQVDRRPGEEPFEDL